MLIGGDGRQLLSSLGVERLSGALRPRELRTRRVGDDVLLIAEW